MKLLEDLERFILTDIAAGLGKESLDPGEDLLEQGIIDSLGVMTLISYIEQNFGIEVTDEDIVPENFQTLYSIARFIEGKTPKAVYSLGLQ